MNINYPAITSKLLQLSFTANQERRIIANGCHDLVIKKDANQINLSISTNHGEIQQLVSFRMSYESKENLQIGLRNSEFVMGTQGIQTHGCPVAAMQLRGEAVVILSEVAEILLSAEVQAHIIDELYKAQSAIIEKMLRTRAN